MVGNAIKFTTRGEIEFASPAYRARPIPGARSRGAHPMSTCATPGSASPNKLAHVFDAFTQADASTTRRFGGTGLGLAICKRLVALANGVLELPKQTGAGSTFGFSLPLTVDAEPPRTPLSHVDLAGRRALIADAHALRPPTVRRHAGGLGHALGDRRRRQRLLALLAAESNFDLVLLDAHLPGVDGFGSRCDCRVRLQPEGAGVPCCRPTPCAARSLPRTGSGGLFHQALMREELLASLHQTFGGARRRPAATAADAATYARAARISRSWWWRTIRPASGWPARSSRALGPFGDPGRQRPQGGRHRRAAPVRPDPHGRADAGDGRAGRDPRDSRCRERRRLPCAMPVVAMTASAMASTARFCVRAGMGNFITDPSKSTTCTRPSSPTPAVSPVPRTLVHPVGRDLAPDRILSASTAPDGRFVAALAAPRMQRSRARKHRGAGSQPARCHRARANPSPTLGKRMSAGGRPQPGRLPAICWLRHLPRTGAGQWWRVASAVVGSRACDAVADRRGAPGRSPPAADEAFDYAAALAASNRQLIAMIAPAALGNTRWTSPRCATA